MSSTERRARLAVVLLAALAAPAEVRADAPDARTIVSDPDYQQSHPEGSGEAPSLCAWDGASSSCKRGGQTPGDGTKPGDGAKPGDGTKPGDGAKPGDGTNAGDGTKPGDGANAGDGTKPGDGAKPGTTKPGDGAGAAGASPPGRPRPAPAPVEDPGDLEPIGEAAGFLAQVLLVMLGAGLIALLVMGAGWLLGRRSPATTRAAADDSTPTPAAPAAPVDPDQAEALARAGRYAEAVHVLLSAGLARLAAVGRSVLADATTSREALASAALDDAGRSALSELVLTVEMSLFGGSAIGRGDYERCSESYRRLVDALRTPASTRLGASG